MRLDPRVELLFDEALDIAVDGEADVGAGTGRIALVRSERNGVAEGVPLVEQVAGGACQLILQGGLQTGQPLLVAPYETENG
jgi:hypothetical protein